jgi:hydroxymethylpyrimidine pyrophosphatase-like HAD family hydrolase
MTVVFDMDNTLVDEFGATVRPGMVGLLTALRKEGHTLVLWTNSRKQRAMDILREHDLRRHFSQCLCREDYDPEERDLPKDIRKVRGDVLIDDDPALIAYVESKGKKGIRIAPFRKGAVMNPRELESIHREINRKRGLFSGLRV